MTSRVTLTDSTCTEPGEKIEKCSVCGDTITTVIDAKGHDLMCASIVK